jgi:hypothetical protein
VSEAFFVSLFVCLTLEKKKKEKLFSLTLHGTSRTSSANPSSSMNAIAAKAAL